MHTHDIPQTEPLPHALPTPPTLTGAATPPVATPASLEGLLTAAWKDAGIPTEPPVGWLTRIATAISQWRDLDPDRPAAPAPDGRTYQELTRLRRLVREQLAGAVQEDMLDIELANGMLDVFGLPSLPRRFTVRLGLPVVCEVTAGSEEEAYDAAEDAIGEALTASTCPIDVDWDGREHLRATPWGGGPQRTLTRPSADEDPDKPGASPAFAGHDLTFAQR